MSWWIHVQRFSDHPRRQRRLHQHWIELGFSRWCALMELGQKYTPVGRRRLQLPPSVLTATPRDAPRSSKITLACPHCCNPRFDDSRTPTPHPSLSWWRRARALCLFLGISELPIIPSANAFLEHCVTMAASVDSQANKLKSAKTHRFFCSLAANLYVTSTSPQ